MPAQLRRLADAIDADDVAEVSGAARVDAGRAGRFGYVVGVDRVGQTAALRQHGADVVVTDLATLLEQP